MAKNLWTDRMLNLVGEEPARGEKWNELDHLPLFERILFERFGRGPEVDLPFHAIHHAIQAQVEAVPDAVALCHEGEQLTYRELDVQSTHIAHLLLQEGVKRGDCVALYLRRSIPMVIGILATLKVGAAYVPQDVKVAPSAQMQHILDVTSSRVILTTADWRHLLPTGDKQSVIAIDEVLASEPSTSGRSEKSGYTEGPRSLPSISVEKSDRCFVLFTSGTTGKPNGVQVTHGNVCNILLTQPGDLGMRPGLSVAQLLSISFDMAAWEILGALSHGATLLIRGDDIREAAGQAHILIATPSVLAQIDPLECPHVRTVAVAGEPCPKPLADRWASVADFYNCCGPTETTIVNTMQLYNPQQGRLTIGRPTANNTVYVLDDELKPCPIGEVGEMWAGGDCVTAGYLANDLLNGERYRPDPFLGGERMMFRTRDLGRWTRDGELEHFGRTDDQVKVRGFRVELDSVSNLLEEEPSCRRAVTLKLDSRTLVSFITPMTADPVAARERVAGGLPYYAVPEHVAVLDEFPITSRGKVDKRALLSMAKERFAAIEPAEVVER